MFLILMSRWKNIACQMSRFRESVYYQYILCCPFSYDAHYPDTNLMSKLHSLMHHLLMGARLKKIHILLIMGIERDVYYCFPCQVIPTIVCVIYYICFVYFFLLSLL